MPVRGGAAAGALLAGAVDATGVADAAPTRGVFGPMFDPAMVRPTATATADAGGCATAAVAVRAALSVSFGSAARRKPTSITMRAADSVNHSE